MPRMGKTEEDWNELKLGFLKTVQPNSFSKFISAVCNFKNNARETYLFLSNLWLCHLHVISLLTFKFHSDWGRVIGKIKKWSGLPWHSPFKHFHIVVALWRQRNVQKGVMHVLGCCFATLNLFPLLPFSLTWPSSLLQLPNINTN